MTWLQKLVLPLVKSLVLKNLNKLDDLKSKIVATLIKSEPFTSNPAQADAVATVAIDAVKAEIKILVEKL